MANFLPLKQYMLLCLDRFIEQYALRDPFLEIGCGAGDVSAHLAEKGWTGVAIDFSETAVERAAANLERYPDVRVARQSLAELDGAYRCVLLFEVLEHIEDDRAALRSIEDLLDPGGHLLLAVPSNPREWRWDDDFYGHFRRYTVDDLRGKLADAGLQPICFWDFTYPHFWAMRRAYTRFKTPPVRFAERDAATKASATTNAWDLPAVSRVLNASAPLWRPAHRATFRLFRNATGKGHEFFALARKPLTS